MVASLSLNGFGIYCIRHQRGTRTNQMLLLQNLSIAEIAKTIYDCITINLYNFNFDLYCRYNNYIDIIEINLMSILFASILLISLDRLSCVMLGIKYKQYITRHFVSEILISIWLIGSTPGLFVWALSSNSYHVKMCFYTVIDIIIITSSVVIYTMVVKLLRMKQEKINASRGVCGRRRRHNKRRTRMYLVPFFIITSFILFNAIPDLVMMNYYESSSSYHLSLILWAIGFISDPIIYIFVNRKCMHAAMESLKSLKRNRLKRVSRQLSRFNSKRHLSVTYEASKRSDSSTKIHFSTRQNGNRADCGE